MEDIDIGWMFVYMCIGILILIYVIYGNMLDFGSLGNSGIGKLAGAFKIK